MRKHLAAARARFNLYRTGFCTCGGWACTLDNLTACRMRWVCDAHDRGMVDG